MAKGAVRRKSVLQATMPSRSLEDAMRVATSIATDFGGDPTKPMLLAQALKVSPSSTNWQYLSGAAAAYGLTTAAHTAAVIGLTDLGSRAASPTEVGDDKRALVEAARTPSVPARFYEKYDGRAVPPDDVAKNVLSSEMSLPAERAEQALSLLRANAEWVGIYTETNGRMHVNCDPVFPGDAEGDAPAKASADLRPPAADDGVGGEAPSIVQGLPSSACLSTSIFS